MKHLPRILAFTHELLRQRLRPGDNALDGTAGNGHDTLLLAQCVGPGGRVWAFDVQPQALQATAERLTAHGAQAQVTLLAAGHETLAQHISAPLTAAVFNFGWLPGSDKSRTTQSPTSLQALNAALALLAPGGLLLAVLYPGHPAGQIEADAIHAWAADLPSDRYAVMQYRFVNPRRPPPHLLAIEKLD